MTKLVNVAELLSDEAATLGHLQQKIEETERELVSMKRKHDTCIENVKRLSGMIMNNTQSLVAIAEDDPKDTDEPNKPGRDTQYSVQLATMQKFIKANKERIHEIFKTPREYENDPWIFSRAKNGGKPVITDMFREMFGIMDGVNGTRHTSQTFVIQLMGIRITGQLAGLRASYVQFRDPRDASKVRSLLKKELDRFRAERVHSH